jgi:hypothetical protein
MQQWPSVIQHAKLSMESVVSNMDDTVEIGPSGDPMLDLFNSISRFSKQRKGEKVLCNFEVAAMHLSIYLKACFL